MADHVLVSCATGTNTTTIVFYIVLAFLDVATDIASKPTWTIALIWLYRLTSQFSNRYTRYHSQESPDQNPHKATSRSLSVPVSRHYCGGGHSDLWASRPRQEYHRHCLGDLLAIHRRLCRHHSSMRCSFPVFFHSTQEPQSVTAAISLVSRRQNFLVKQSLGHIIRGRLRVTHCSWSKLDRDEDVY